MELVDPLVAFEWWLGVGAVASSSVVVPATASASSAEATASSAGEPSHLWLLVVRLSLLGLVASSVQCRDELLQPWLLLFPLLVLWLGSPPLTGCSAS